MKTHYFFDWSGTIHDNLSTFMAVCEQLFPKHGLQAPSREEVRATMVSPWMNWWSKYIDNLDLKQHHQDYTEALRNVSKTEYCEGMLDVIKTLHAQGKTLFVISTDPKERLLAELGENKKYFKEVIFGIHEKDEVILDLLEGYHVNSKNAVYIGDLATDAEEAHKAGIDAWLVPWGFNTKERLEEHNPERIIEKPEEFLEES